jgi:cell division protein FtsL
MLSIYVVMIIIEYVSIKCHAWNMEIEIEKLKKLIESERNRQSHSGVQPYNYMSMR